MVVKFFVIVNIYEYRVTPLALLKLPFGIMRSRVLLKNKKAFGLFLGILTKKVFQVKSNLNLVMNVLL